MMVRGFGGPLGRAVREDGVMDHLWRQVTVSTAQVEIFVGVIARGLAAAAHLPDEGAHKAVAQSPRRADIEQVFGPVVRSQEQAAVGDGRLTIPWGSAPTRTLPIDSYRSL